MKTFIVTIEGREQGVRIDEQGNLFVDGMQGPVDVRRLSENEFSVTFDGQPVRVVAVREEERLNMLVAGRSFTARAESERTRLLRRYSQRTGMSGSRREVHAPMPAMIVKVGVTVGQDVTAGEGLLVLEAMKMENEIRADQPGRIKTICVKQGDAVEKGALLLLFE